MNENTTILPLTQNGERIRCEIKSMIPGGPGESRQGKAERLAPDIKGAIMYGGDELATKVSELIKEMKIGKWPWTLAQFPKTKEIVNDSFQMYLIPLSANLELSWKIDEVDFRRVLEEGQYAFVKINPTISAGASVLFITPPV
ncbi:unnamed protein product [Penicillium manginii]